jgi:hypothetical protein
MASDLGGIALVTSAATWIGGADVPGAVRVAALVAFAVPMGLAFGGPTLAGRTRAPFLGAWREVPPLLGAAQILARAIDMAIVVVMAWSASRAFGLAIPFVAFATYMPVILFATSLPISVAGFGAAQAAWLVFLPWARGEQILAFQLLWQVFMGLGIVARGLLFVRAVVREIRGNDATEP